MKLEENKSVLVNDATDIRFEEVVAPHMGMMHAVAQNILQCHELAHDAVQETLIRAWSYGTLPREPRGVLLFLVRQSSLHALRCARRRRDHESLAYDHAAGEPCCALDPANEINAREELSLVLEAMVRMNREHKESLDLVGRNGLTYQEAASRLGTPVGTIRSRTSRARAELRRLTSYVHIAPTTC